MANGDTPDPSWNLPKGKANYGPAPEIEEMSTGQRLKAAGRQTLMGGLRTGVQSWRQTGDWNKMKEYEKRNNDYPGRQPNPRGGSNGDK